jgi:hypothetical protein
MTRIDNPGSARERGYEPRAGTAQSAVTGDVPNERDLRRVTEMGTSVKEKIHRQRGRPFAPRATRHLSPQ